MASSQRLHAAVHAGDAADGRFTFPADDPTATQGGQPAAELISYTADADAPDRENAGIRDDELPESGGVPPGALLAAGTLLPLSSAACLSLVPRRGVANGS